MIDIVKMILAQTEETFTIDYWLMSGYSFTTPSNSTGFKETHRGLIIHNPSISCGTNTNAILTIRTDSSTSTKMFIPSNSSSVSLAKEELLWWSGKHVPNEKRTTQHGYSSQCFNDGMGGPSQ